MNTNTKSVRLKTSVILENSREPAHLNFIPMGDLAPIAEDYGVQDEQHKVALNKFLNYMKSLDEQFFTWLEADASNTVLFAHDPIKALHIAIPDFDETALKGLNKAMFQ